MPLAMNKLQNYIKGRWIEGEGEGQALHDAVNGEVIAHASSAGIDFAGALEYARRKGNPALRKMTFHERGRMLKAIALHLQQHLLRAFEFSPVNPHWAKLMAVNPKKRKQKIAMWRIPLFVFYS